ncbi:outer membrane porin, OprD family [Pseudomonas sp. FW305-E2]|uniref:OprD family outer membrane porin n=1 Tax=Pseudomonas sp. FW305-E2 TaxID=2075558 RepID=UPI000B4ECCAD|nr:MULTISPECIES: OprD family outer membrane porin [Pseudomonas]POA81633.1 outer membrane porin, OprD family [Pseudomonas sp. FW305-E2]
MRLSSESLTPLLAFGLISYAGNILAEQPDGFLQDSSLTLNLKNYYYNHDGKNGGADGRDWSQAAQISYTSGFTTGTVGLGIDAFLYSGLKLDKRFSGAGNVPNNDNTTWSQGGGSLKARVYNTTLKYGTQQTSAPVFAVAGSRITPQTATGFSLFSKDIKDLTLDAGHFTSGNGPRGTTSGGELGAAYAGVSASHIDYLGGNYSPFPTVSFSLYGANLENIWNQYYFSAQHVYTIDTKQALTLNFNGYRTMDSGSAKAGEIDTKAFSLAVSYSYIGHKLMLAYQKVGGDTPFDYIGVGNEGSFGDSIYLMNAVQVSDFNGPGEQSLQVRYDYNFRASGLPGLTFLARYLKGWGSDGRNMSLNSEYQYLNYGSDGKEQEIDVEFGYVVQTGPAKDLALRLRQAFYTANGDLNGVTPDTVQTRIHVSYPLNIF